MNKDDGHFTDGKRGGGGRRTVICLIPKAMQITICNHESSPDQILPEKPPSGRYQIFSTVSLDLLRVTFLFAGPKYITKAA